jgi:hypothetical protein
LPGSRGLGGGGEVAQTMYTHVIKYKNYKIKGKIKNNLLFGRQRLKRCGWKPAPTKRQ